MSVDGESALATEAEMKHVEVIANPPLETTRLIISTPVYNEWSNSNLVKHMRSMLSQKLEGGVSIEANYILNRGFLDDDDRYPLSAEKMSRGESEMESSKVFLTRMVQLQQMARDGVEPEVLRGVIDQEPDSLLRGVLADGVRRCREVVFSAVAVRDKPDDYKYMRKIDTLRTMGMDYVYQRANPEAAMSLFDCDTVMERRFAQKLIAVYSLLPEVHFIFSGVGYQPPEGSKNLAAHSPEFAGFKSWAYNSATTKDTPQISFRVSDIKLMERIQYMIWEGDEDRDTSLRLGIMFAEVQQNVLSREVMTLPYSLASDRDGMMDGIRRALEVAKEEPKDLGSIYERVKEEEVKFNETLDGLGPEKAIAAKSYHKKVRADYVREMKVQLRMNRMVVSEYLKRRESGNVENMSPAVDLFVRNNAEMLEQITAEELDYARYLLGERETLPETITELSPFETAMREYLGDYASDYSNEELVAERDVANRESLLYPTMAESMALNATYFTFAESTMIGKYLEKYKDEEIFSRRDPYLRDPNIEKRSQWANLSPKKNQAFGLARLLERAGFKWARIWGR